MLRARHLSLATWLLGGWLAAGPAAAQTAPPLTLAQAVNEALSKNERLLNQADATTQADLGLRLARNTFKPKVTPNIFGSFGRTDISSQVYRVDLSQKLTTGTDLRLSVGTASSQIPSQSRLSDDDVLFYNADTTLSLTQPLLRGFGASVARRSLTSTELRRVDAGRQQSMAEQQVAIDVAGAYYRLVAQQTFVDVARQSIARARRLRDASEAKLDAGLVSQLDVLRSQQLVAQAEIQFFDTQAGVEEARDRLANLMGRTAAEAFEVRGDIPRPPTEPVDVAQATTVALGNRLDLRSRIASRDDAENQIRYTKNQLLPQVDVNLALTRRETADSFKQSFALDGYQFATFFTIAMPVDRTAQQVDYQSALLDRDRRRREVTTLERQIVDDVRQALRERDRLLRGVVSAETSVEIGRREVEVAQMRYQTGLSNNLDVVTAESGLLAAESRRIQALADSAIARLRLRALLGVLDPRTDMTDSTVAVPITLNLAQRGSQ